MARDRTIPVLLLVLAAFLAGAVLLPSWAVSLVTVALAKAMVILGLLVLLRAGLVPFGQALFFALGAYGAGMVLREVGGSDFVLAFLAGSLAALVVAFALGFLMSRYREIFFAMLSLAFSMLLYGLLVKNVELGGTDGFNIPSPTFLGWDPPPAIARRVLLAATAIAALLAHMAVHVYLQSTMGRMATAIRDNEIRVEYLGASVRRVIHIKFMIAGTLAGMGGVITAFSAGHIDPGMSYWTSSGEFVFVTIMSGAGSVLAPILGSLLFEVVRTYAVQYAPQTWQAVIGIVLLLIILFLPAGLWSLFRRRAKARP
ncbi:MAG: branched-chain amino acid ABC transporter permease [Alphaproteobacteria bacterium]